MDLSRVPTHGSQRRLVHQVRELRAREPGQIPRKLSQIQTGSDPVLPGVHLEDLEASLFRGKLDLDLPVEPPRPHKRRIQEVRAIRGRHQDDPGVRREAVHLRKQLIEGLLPLLVGLRLAICPRKTERIDLVDENDAGSIDARPLEEVSHPGCSHSHDDLHKLRTRHFIKRYARFPGDGLGHEGLARSGTTLQQQTLGRLCAESGEPDWILQELHHLLELFHFPTQTTHVVELDAGFPFFPRQALGLAKLDRLHRIRGHSFPRLEDAEEQADHDEPRGPQDEHHGGKIVQEDHVRLGRRAIEPYVEVVLSGAIVGVRVRIIRDPVLHFFLVELFRQPPLERPFQLFLDLIVPVLAQVVLERLPFHPSEEAVPSSGKIGVEEALGSIEGHVHPGLLSVQLGDEDPLSPEAGFPRPSTVPEHVHFPRIGRLDEVIRGPVPFSQSLVEFHERHARQVLPVRFHGGLSEGLSHHVGGQHGMHVSVFVLHGDGDV
eukprot:scaffold492_cov341-Pavlova_lutheri.AAC.2